MLLLSLFIHLTYLKVSAVIFHKKKRESLGADKSFKEYKIRVVVFEASDLNLSEDAKPLSFSQDAVYSK